MNEDEKKPLIIPSNCPPVRYVVNGFTHTDVSIVLLTGGVALFIGIVMFVITNNSIKAVSCVVFMIAAVAMILHRDIYTENMIDKVRIIHKFKKSTKSFIYYYADELSKYMEKK